VSLWMANTEKRGWTGQKPHVFAFGQRGPRGGNCAASEGQPWPVDRLRVLAIGRDKARAQCLAGCAGDESCCTGVAYVTVYWPWHWLTVELFFIWQRAAVTFSAGFFVCASCSVVVDDAEPACSGLWLSAWPGLG